ncbi:MAG: nucleotidyltransferase domain-containing protein [Candidatus Omnitrophica bacterium]|nr:nucleotidyltransferase domain-containing protein [Candidatus Omnitrophota bacterium]
MTVNEFLQDLLKSQTPTSGMLDDLASSRGEVEGFLREKFGDSPKIRYAGSKAKGTMIKENYDLDIICYFPRDCGSEIEEIYKDVYKKLQEKYSITPKTTALRVQKIANDKSQIDYHIDVVPGRFVDEKEQDAFLYQAQGKVKWIKTNLDTHIRFFKESGCVEVIKLAKIWNIRDNVNLKTFMLELLVVKCLSGSRSKSDLEISFKKVLECMGDEIIKIRLEDPANTNNIVSDNCSEVEKNTVALRAKSALSSINKDPGNTDVWRSIFKESSPAKVIAAGPSVIVRNPSKPWCI